MKKKILTVCNGGNCRSVALAEMLKGTYNCEAISSSTYWLSHQTMEMLCEWADLILLVEPWDAKLPEPDLTYWKKSPAWMAKYAYKRKVFPLGPDAWGHAKYDEMKNKIASLMIPEIYR